MERVGIDDGKWNTVMVYPRQATHKTTLLTGFHDGKMNTIKEKDFPWRYSFYRQGKSKKKIYR